MTSCAEPGPGGVVVAAVRERSPAARAVTVTVAPNPPVLTVPALSALPTVVSVGQNVTIIETVQNLGVVTDRFVCGEPKDGMRRLVMAELTEANSTLHLFYPQVLDGLY